MSDALILRAEGRSIKEKGVLAMEGPAVVRPQFPFLAVQARASTLLDRLSVARPGCCRNVATRKGGFELVSDCVGGADCSLMSESSVGARWMSCGRSVRSYICVEATQHPGHAFFGPLRFPKVTLQQGRSALLFRASLPDSSATQGRPGCG